VRLSSKIVNRDFGRLYVPTADSRIRRTRYTFRSMPEVLPFKGVYPDEEILQEHQAGMGNLGRTLSAPEGVCRL